MRGRRLALGGQADGQRRRAARAIDGDTVVIGAYNDYYGGANDDAMRVPS